MNELTRWISEQHAKLFQSGQAVELLVDLNEDTPFPLLKGDQGYVRELKDHQWGVIFDRYPDAVAVSRKLNGESVPVIAACAVTLSWEPDEISLEQSLLRLQFAGLVRQTKGDDDYTRFTLTDHGRMALGMLSGLAVEA
ncbi:MAG: hypothetical protein K8L99_15300 [Anaerolineae bacterium]|nr:hypothetical protein [Anaerolineae bacterium]